ncbi:hypothetical protein ASG31_06355 [Chryseobacterium sp. Leaf404]|uniref:TIGR02594 family protein n=1 Tax=unclassified Chryseobacterium TaxID=2593645 RepID=UPI0006FDCC9C|nr:MULTISPECIES: TIGR02594 family protein [unclassified Chryseobacterium]KQT18346.1 hypothetical protein ASG31_06355 [Chryseobacterium sp. Leaf404]
MKLTNEYKWLADESGPLMIKNALSLLDVAEALGVQNNHVILSWADEIGGDVDKIYIADSIPWCGLFMAIVAKRSSKNIVKDPLWALNWGTFGKYTEIAMLGDVLVFVRTTSTGSKAGHVGLYVGEDDKHYHVLGGNQSDKVCIRKILKSRLYTARRPLYNNQPSNIRRIRILSGGIETDGEQ